MSELDLEKQFADLQTALDYVMLKTELQRLGVVGGGYGLLVCAYGAPADHHTFYLVQIIIGGLLFIEGLVEFFLPDARHFIVLGALMALMGIWTSIMAKYHVAAGGSSTLFAAWGLVFIILGIVAFFDYRRFAHFISAKPTTTTIMDAGIIVKKLLSANPKKQTDVVIVDIALCCPSRRHFSLKEQLAAAKIAGKWKGRLLEDAIVFVRRSNALVLPKKGFQLDATGNVVAKIGGNLYEVKPMRESSARFEEWSRSAK